MLASLYPHNSFFVTVKLGLLIYYSKQKEARKPPSTAARLIPLPERNSLPPKPTIRAVLPGKRHGLQEDARRNSSNLQLSVSSPRFCCYMPLEPMCPNPSHALRRRFLWNGLETMRCQLHCSTAFRLIGMRRDLCSICSYVMWNYGYPLVGSMETFPNSTSSTGKAE